MFNNQSFSSNPHRKVTFTMKLANTFLYHPRISKLLSASFLLSLAMWAFISVASGKWVISLVFLFLIPLFFSPLWFCLLIYCLYSSFKINRLIKYGSITSAKLRSKVKTNMLVKGEGHVYRLTFKFSTIDKVISEFSINISNPKTIERISNNKIEDIIYDPTKPSKAVLLFTIPAMQMHENKNSKKVIFIKTLWMSLVSTSILLGIISGILFAFSKLIK